MRARADGRFGARAHLVRWRGGLIDADPQHSAREDHAERAEVEQLARVGEVIKQVLRILRALVLLGALAAHLLELGVPVYHLACQIGALGAGSGRQLAAGTARELASRPCWMGRGAPGTVLASGGRGGVPWQREDAASTDLSVQPAPRPEPDEHLERGDLARVLTVLVDAALPHPRPEQAAPGPRDGPPKREAAQHEREEDQEDGVEHL